MKIIKSQRFLKTKDAQGVFANEPITFMNLRVVSREVW